ncbi:hypothetical protein BDV11DRAFT_181817 [Aspergillus similis]
MTAGLAESMSLARAQRVDIEAFGKSLMLVPWRCLAKSSRPAHPQSRQNADTQTSFTEACSFYTGGPSRSRYRDMGMIASTKYSATLGRKSQESKQ